MTVQEIKDALKVVGTEKLREIILESEKVNGMSGFAFCSNGNITVTDVSHGGSIQLEVSSCGDKKDIGTFRTNPMSNNASISEQDIRYSIWNNKDFMCIGAIENKEPIVKCYHSYYGVDKDIAIDFVKSMKKWMDKVHKYNPTGSYEEIQKLSREKDIELSELLAKSSSAKEKFDKAAEYASQKLLKAPNQGADYTINL